MTLHSKRGKIVGGLILVFVSWIVLCGLYLVGLYESYELKTYDLLCRLEVPDAPKPKDVVLVELDQGSLEAAAKQGVNWPWPRQMYAPMVDFCFAAGARSVVFDVLFTEDSSYGVEDDRLLAESLREGSAILPFFLSREKRSPSAEEEKIVDRAALVFENRKTSVRKTFHSMIMPIEILARSAYGFGNVETSPDADGIYRRLPLVFPYRDQWLPSLGLSVFADQGQKINAVMENGRLMLGDLSVPVDRQGRFLLRYYGGGKEFPRYSAYNLIQSQLALQEKEHPIYDPADFNGKIVFIGFTAAGLFDLKPTPTSSVYPGMSIHATLVANLLHKDFRTRLSPPAVLALTAVVMVATALTVMLVAGFLKLGAVVTLLAAGLVCLDIFAFYRNLWIDAVLPMTGILLSFAVISSFSYATEGRHRRRLRQLFSHYMSDLLLDDLVKNPEKLRLGGDKKVMTVFFSDLAGFTTLSEKLTPEDVVSLLNRYLTAMTDIILESGGFIDKYEGDAIMAFWGAPVPQQDHAVRACLAALDNQSRLGELRREFAAAGLPSVRARIGINTGEMIIGNMGSSKRFEFTVIGDNVNLASRLEGAGKEYGTKIIVSEDTYRAAADAVEVRELDLLQVKGKEIPVRIYELLCRKGELDEKMREVRDSFERGLKQYRIRQWRQAILSFQQVLSFDPEDGPSLTFIGRCEEYLANPPQENWAGVYRLTTK